MSIFNPIITDAGMNAAFDAGNMAIELPLTHIGFGLGSYDPTGAETALLNEVVRVAIASGQRIAAAQIRVSAVWHDDSASSPINEVGFYSNGILFAVWSRSNGEPLAYKTPNVDFVSFYDLVLTQVPLGSVTVLADTGQSAVLAALATHTAEPEAHPQYMKRIRRIWCATAGGTTNSLNLTIPLLDAITTFDGGQGLIFIAAHNNTTAVDVTVDAIGTVSLKKNGGSNLDANDLIAGGLYEAIWDGTNLQLASGLGGGGGSTQVFSTTEFTATSSQTDFVVNYTVGNVFVLKNGSQLLPSVYDALNGTDIILHVGATTGDKIEVVSFEPFNVANVVDLSNNQNIAGIKTFVISPRVPTPSPGDNSSKGASTAYVDNAVAGVSLPFATALEIATGTVTNKVVSPAGLSSLQATTSLRGLIRLATSADAISLTPSSVLALTPATLVARTATQTRTGIARVATPTEVLAGTDDTLIVSPAGLASVAAGLPIGGILQSASPAVKPGFLSCHNGTWPTGAAVSRSTYPDLFADLVTNVGFTLQTFTVTIASPAVFTKSTHGFKGNERLRLSTTGALPTGLNASTDYFVEVINSGTFYLLDAPNGNRINTSGSQSGTQKYLQSIWGLGDGLTTFNLPLLSDEFMRGMSSNHPLGTWEADMFKAHNHANGSSTDLVSNTNNGGGILDTAGAALSHSAALTVGGAETRPRNLRMFYSIKAFSAPINQGVIDISSLQSDLTNLTALVATKGLFHVGDSGHLTSGTIYTSPTIPSGTRKIEILVRKVSLTAGDDLFMQVGIGLSPTWIATTYAGNISTGSASTTWSSSAARLTTALAASDLYDMNVTLSKMENDMWHIEIRGLRSNNADNGLDGGFGEVNATADITAIKIYNNGASTFDDGNITINCYR